jgi:hypothetical protein
VRSLHIHEVWIAGTDTRLNIVADRPGEVTLDEGWEPYVQASLRIAMPAPEVFDQLDPRTGVRCRIRLERAHGTLFTLADVTAGQGGSTASWTAVIGGSPLSSMTALYSRPLNSFGHRASLTRRLDLAVIDRTVDVGEASVTLELASDEALLQVTGLVDDAPRAPTTPTVRAAAAMVLESIGATLQPGTDDADLEVDAVAWEPGVTGWDYIRPLVSAGALRLWSDELRRWYLTPPLTATAGGLVIVAPTAFEEQLSRVSGWCNAVVVTYRWEVAGVEQVRYDVATALDWTPQNNVTHRVEYRRPWPRDGAAAAILARRRAMGRIIAVRTVSDYTATPGQAMSTMSVAGPDQTGLLASVTWNLDDDEMQVQSRDLLDTPPAAWLALAAGESWLDSPVGESWIEEVI